VLVNVFLLVQFETKIAGQVATDSNYRRRTFASKAKVKEKYQPLQHLKSGGINEQTD